ncbi:dihydroorotase [Alphaproteobacteria bacterium]|nr:dihydroorotase [Alphaproteobacteria bacterium]
MTAADTIKSLAIRRPDDLHLHLRDGAMLAAVVADTAQHFGRAIVMPNLVPPVVTAADASAYRERILDHLSDYRHFQPLMTLYLTETTDAVDVIAAAKAGIIHAVKLYPAGATTNSVSGVRDFDRVRPVLEAMAEIGLPLCVHGEVTDPSVDIFDREAVFIDRVLTPLRAAVPGLRVILEHVTTADAVDFVRDAGCNMAATITTHHLFINRNHILAGGIRPHYYCLPVAKRERHRLALVAAATSGVPQFFLGTDSAPHLDTDKQSACGCAGIYTAPNTLSCLAHVFESGSALHLLEGFTSLHGASFYGLPPAEDRIKLVKRNAPVTFPASRTTAHGEVTIFDCGVPLYWEVETSI